MNKLNIKGNWNIPADKLKNKYAELTDDVFLFKEDNEELLLERLQLKLVKTKVQIRLAISAL